MKHISTCVIACMHIIDCIVIGDDCEISQMMILCHDIEKCDAVCYSNYIKIQSSNEKKK